ncbi:hypothetical protein TD95_002069 [Thielaviopsis punctulata]|uniref:ER membrane protein complex subunit 1 n=1 Tax=Thielaviopsis punctulata TaxID=72032 RepID=A0A0F4ZIX5_9PEZI|nr:hypothetical protein TD95_002069 [Thielaviopsis punctulata]
MRFFPRAAAAFAVAALTRTAAAIFADEVGEIDFHYSLIGLPQANSTFFYAPKAAADSDPAISLLYTLSDIGVLGSVDPDTGSVRWRQFLAQDGATDAGVLRVAGDKPWLISVYGAKVQAWRATDGRNVWSYSVPEGNAVDAAIYAGETGSKDILVLAKNNQTRSVARLNALDGSLVWSAPLEIAADRIVFKADKPYVVGSTNSGIVVAKIDYASGSVTDKISLGGKDATIEFVGGLKNPVIVWTAGSKANVVINVIGSKKTTEYMVAPITKSIEVVPSANNEFLIHTRATVSGTANVFTISGEVAKKVYEFDDIKASHLFSTALLDGETYFVKKHPKGVTVHNAVSSNVLAEWPLGIDSKEKKLLSAISEASQTSNGIQVRSATLTDTLEWIYLVNGNETWARPEGLSNSTSVAFSTPEDDDEITRALQQETHTNPMAAYMHRVARHAKDLTKLPAYLAALPQTLSDAIYSPGASARDTFGFNKTLIVATSRGRLYGIETTAGGPIKWSKQVKPYVSGEPWNVVGLYANDTLGELALIDSQGMFAVVEISSGNILFNQNPPEPITVQSSVTMHSSVGPWVLPVLAGGNINNVTASRATNTTVVVRGDAGEVKGIKFDKTGKTYVSWSFVPPAGHELYKLIRRQDTEQVASIARVLGDRSVMYKYLNPNTVLVALTNAADATLMTVLLDTVSGQVLASQTHKGVDAAATIDCVLSENWYACVFFSTHIVQDGSGRIVSGNQLVMSDLYESSTPNDRGALGASDSFSPLAAVDTPGAAPLPHVVSQAFVISVPLSSLAVSQTLQGISRRQILAYSGDLHTVFGLPREVFDPRRPVNRDATAAEMEAEGLAKYAAGFEIDPKMSLSHARDVLADKIVAVPTKMESSSMVAAHGVDVFVTRLAPSGTFDILGRGFDRVLRRGIDAAWR